MTASSNLARGAAMLCQNKKVWDYINTEYNEELCKHPEHARDWMYSEFGIASRRELDGSPAAAERYLRFVEDFNGWLRGYGKQKRLPWESKKLLAAANGAPCVRCDKCDGTVVACHGQGELATLFGKGWAQKPDDHLVAELCYSCHQLMDSYHGGNNPQYTLEWAKLILKTHARWFREGVVLVA